MKAHRLVAIRPTSAENTCSCTDRAFVFGGSLGSNRFPIRRTAVWCMDSLANGPLDMASSPSGMRE